ncbi:MAG: hypothetical protein IT356_12495 [Gemmatimonadaceae bacterium]|nr:hypothetical protein [Gemmatimonadaceae bacterium]
MTLYQRWVALLCYVDMTTGEKPSFSKIVCAVILLAAVAQRSLTLGVIIALLAASFGRSVFVAFLHRAQISAEDTHQTTRQEIIERRDTEAGVEPAP